jgi:hypothetical protein
LVADPRPAAEVGVELLGLEPEPGLEPGPEDEGGVSSAPDFISEASWGVAGLLDELGLPELLTTCLDQPRHGPWCAAPRPAGGGGGGGGGC